MIWLTSDWHFCHNKPFLYEPRGFENQYEMNEVLISNYNKLIDRDDDVYCLGDCMLSDTELGLECLKNLKGKIHIIRGNHDTDNRLKAYASCYNIVEICDAKFLKVGKQSFFLSHYPALTANYDDGKALKTKTISLCGHTHTPDKFIDLDKGLIYHVEVDAHDNHPISIEQIIMDLKERI